MSTERVQCGKREYTLESRITKNGHKYIMITEKSSGRVSKVIVFHDHYDVFLESVKKTMEATPIPNSSASAEPVSV